MYRPSANPPRTGWARLLDGVMRENGWSRVRLFEEVGGELGYSPKSRSGFLKLLEDREPTEAQAAVLRSHFGEPEPADETTIAEPSLAAALSELAGELRASREDRESLETRLRAVEAELGSLRAQLEAAGSPRRSAPRGTAG